MLKITVIPAVINGLNPITTPINNPTINEIIKSKILGLSNILIKAVSTPKIKCNICPPINKIATV